MYGDRHMMKHALALVCLFTPLAATAGVSQTLDDLRALVDSGEVGAASVAFLSPDNTEIHHFGATSPGGQQPSDDSVYEIGSISKVLTALMVTELVEREQLTLETTLQNVFPGVDFDDQAVADISLRALLTHRSGLPRMPDNFDPADLLDPFADYDMDALYAFFDDFDQLSTNDMVYSNLGMGIAGVVAARTLDTTYDRALQELISKPLNLTDTVQNLNDDQRSRMVPGFWDGARMPNWHFDALAGAGGVRSTVQDMVKFARAQLQPPLSPLAAAIARTQARQDDDMALGWMIRHSPDGERSVLWHNGATGGYASFIALNLDAQRAVVVLTASAAHDAVTRAGFRFFVEDRTEDDSTERNLTPYVGTYRMGEQGLIIQITQRRGQLFAQLSGQGKLAIYPSDQADTFDYRAVEAQLSFERDGETSRSVTLYQGGQTMPAGRVSDALALDRFSPIAVAAADLQQYVGDYDLNWFVTITVSEREGQLFAQLTKQSPMPIFAYAPDKFFYKAVDAQLHFVRDDDGKIEAVELHQNGVQKAERD